VDGSGCGKFYGTVSMFLVRTNTKIPTQDDVFQAEVRNGNLPNVSQPLGAAVSLCRSVFPSVRVHNILIKFGIYTRYKSTVAKLLRSTADSKIYSDLGSEYIFTFT